MSTRKNKKTPATLISTLDGLEAACRRYVDTRLALLRRKAKQERAIAELQAEHAAANTDDEAAIVELETGIQLFAETHRAELLPDESRAKSRDFGPVALGFRTNPPSVGKLVARDTWDSIAARLDALPWGAKFVKETISLDKAALLLARTDLTEGQLAAAGIKFEQGETFFIECASDLLDAARKPAAESEAAK